MPITVSHGLSATTPDDPAYEIRPSHWNDTHAITLSLAASEISGLFSNANGVSFGSSNGSITASIAAGGAPGSLSAGTTNFGLGEVVFSNSNGVSFGLDGATVTATIATNYQSQGAYLTTAALSNHSHGNPTLALTNLSGTTASNSAGLTLSLSAGNYLTTAMASNRGSDFVQATAAFAGTSASGTIASGGISVSIGPYITTGMLSNAATISNVRVSGGTTSNLLSAITFADGSGVSWGLNAGTMTATVKTDYQTAGAYLTTAALSNHSHGVSFTSGSVAFQTLSFTNSNGISFNSGTQGIFGSHNAITTGRASTDAIGLGTAQTNVTWTANSAGLSFNAGGYAGTATGFTGANISATITHNTVGLSLSLSVAAPGAAAENNWFHALGANTAGNTTASGSTIGLSGINLTISGTNASMLNLSVPATSSLVGINNIAISTAGSTISVRNEWNSHYRLVDYVQGTTALPAAAASTVIVQPMDLPYPISISYVRIPMSLGHVQTSSASTAARTWSLQQFDTFHIGFYSMGTGANSRSLQYVGGSSVGATFSKIYQVGAASNNQSCSYSASIPSEGNTVAYTTSFGVNSASMVLHTTILSNSIVGNKWLDIPFGSSLSAGHWWFAIQRSTTTGSSSAGGNWVNITAAKQDISWYGASQPNIPILPWGVNTSASTGAAWQVGLGGWTTNTNGFTSSSMALSHILSTANHPLIPIILIRQA